MKVAPGAVVTLTYDLCSEDGEVIESSELSGPVTFVHGQGRIIPGLDAKLVGLDEGAEAELRFTPEEAFGRPEDAPRKTLAKGELPPGAATTVGARFEAGLPSGQTIVLEVVDVSANDVTVRMIHPLAGQALSMSVRVEKVREATATEKETGVVAVRPPKPPGRPSAAN